MSKLRRPLQVGTIGSLIAERLRLTISCGPRECGHDHTFDLEALKKLAGELGPDNRIADLVARSRCSECGAKWPQLSVRVGPVHTGGMRGVLRQG